MRRREKKVLISIAGGLLVGVTAAAIDLMVVPFERVILVHQLIGDVIAALMTMLVCLAIQLRYEEMYYRFAMEKAAIIAELNHHVRNAVFPVCLAVQRQGDENAIKVANEAVDRINIALKDAAADAFALKIDYSAPAGEAKVQG